MSENLAKVMLTKMHPMDNIIEATKGNPTLQKLLKQARDSSFSSRKIRVSEEQKSSVNHFTTAKPCINLEKPDLIKELERRKKESFYLTGSNNIGRERNVELITTNVDKTTNFSNYIKVKEAERWIENKYQELNWRMGNSTVYNEKLGEEFDHIDLLQDCVKRYQPDEKTENQANQMLISLLTGIGMEADKASTLVNEKIRIMDEKSERLFNKVNKIKGCLYNHFKNGGENNRLSFDEFKEIVNNLPNHPSIPQVISHRTNNKEIKEIKITHENGKISLKKIYKKSK